MSKLLPCPFCGLAGENILLRENGKQWLGSKYGEPSSVSVQHWCPPIPGQPSRMIERVGRDEASAIAAWHRRATPTAPEDAAEARRPDERAAFEAWWKQTGQFTKIAASEPADGEFEKAVAKAAWRARASLPQPKEPAP